MRFRIAVCFGTLLFPFSTATYADDFPSISEMLALSKFVGLCGAMHQQTNFQESTQMNGGLEFVVRFWTTEAARLGKTIPEYVTACNEAVPKYEFLFRAISDAENADGE